jgi:hypothetical protein
MEPEYEELNMCNYDEDLVAKLNTWGIWAVDEIDRLRLEIGRLQTERNQRIARDCAMDEVDELMDCVNADGTFEDLDQHTPGDMQTTTGSTIAWLMHRCYTAENIVKHLGSASDNQMITKQIS